MPTCEMASHVLFYVIQGEAGVQVNRESAILKEGQCLITEPATLSMKTENGVRIFIEPKPGMFSKSPKPVSFNGSRQGS
jgi:quercetin dioxygenase-like cupin family protein